MATNSLDYHYFSTIDEANGPFYDWERQLINIPYLTEELLAPSAPDGYEGRLKFSKLVHEYIHYLQNFATTWGAPVFTDFSLAIMKIGASSVEDSNIIELPLVVDNLRNDLLREGFELRATVNERVIRFDDAEFYRNRTLTSIIEIAPSADGVTLTNGRVKVQLGITHIREHMAHMGTQLFLGNNDLEIHEFHRDCPGFQEKGVAFSNQTQYWMLFEYLYQLDIFSELALGIFHLSQQCLTMLAPEKALARFFRWLNLNPFVSRTRLPFIECVNSWLSSKEEAQCIAADYSKAINHCDAILRLCNNHSDHDLFVFTAAITSYALNNLRSTSGGRLLFRPTDNFQSPNYWKQKIMTYGTGLVMFKDGVQLIGSQNHQDAMTDSFNFLVSASLVIKKLDENRIGMCPFLDDIKICTSVFREDSACFRNPFLIKAGDGGYCLFGNGVELTGLRGRVNFDS